MKQWVQKYTGTLRGLRIFYWLYNLTHLGKLKKNKQLYKQFGVNKTVWQSISHADIKLTSTNEIPWMDKPTITQEAIQQHSTFTKFSPAIQQQLLQWPANGFMIIPALLENKADEINTEIERLQTENKVGFNFTGRKIMDAWQHSPVINEVFKNDTILQILQFIFQKEVIPFQTINFIYGSEQKPHSDSIHMTTEPLGYLAAIWIALEDIQAGSGELVYYPASHQLNYVLSEDYNTGNNALKIGEHNYDNYEQKIDAVIQNNHLQPQTFLAKKGDVFIWHANLLHGGSAITNPALTRKSMVAHYYADGVLCYHEISQRPAVIKNNA
jgi:ectoine hydroxylase